MLLPDPNSLFIILIIISGIAEFFLPTTQSTGLRFGIVVVALFSTMFSSGALVAGNLTVFSALIMVLAVYRVVNQLRAVEERRTQAGRKHTVRKTLYVLFCAQLAVYIAGIIWKQHGNSNLIQSALVGVAAISVLISLGLLLHAATVLRRGNITGIEPEKQLKKLPTLSVLIPARNETQDLTACLEALLASSYPKMEIIVYDDCSQDDTPGIIRSFAAKGVRFIKGEPLPERWLAKNFAYQQLAKQASGELLLFMGVDVRVQPQSVSLMVAAMREKSLSMLSVLPKRSGQGLLASLVQPMRYWWELAPPRWAIGHPPVLSTCWLIDTKSYTKFGGMKAVAKAVIPETYFARESSKLGSYRFVYGGTTIGVFSIKNIREQLATAIRTRYPQHHRSIWRVAAVSLFEAVFLLGPFIVLASTLFVATPAMVVLLAAAAAFFLTLLHLMITVRTNPGIWWLSVISYPFVVLSELVIMQLSMYRYEFSEVDWKGRNVCTPLMLQAIPALPTIDEPPADKRSRKAAT